jgi:SAM-dependent methyltransferase
MNTQPLNDEGREMWNQKSAFWDQMHGDGGNSFHQTLIYPSVEKLLDLQPGEKVLDIACGSGVLARQLAALGAQVTACDFSEGQIERAKARRQSAGKPIDYQVMDATDENALITLGEGQFDAVVTTMALMDMPTVSPLFRATKRLLKPVGRFVFANAHPAFNSNNPVFIAEMADRDGTLHSDYGLKIFDYLTPKHEVAVGHADEPNPHHSYHRPLSQLLGEAFAAGLVMDGIEEPSFPVSETAGKRLSWLMMPDIPPVLTCRFRPNPVG